MASIRRLKNVVVTGFVVLALAGFWLLLRQTSQVAAQTETVGISDVFAVSDNKFDTMSYFIPLDKFPKRLADASNWPVGCNGLGLKALPLLPGVPIYNGTGEDPYNLVLHSTTLTEHMDDWGGKGWSFNKNGAYRNAEGNCEEDFGGMGLTGISGGSGNTRLEALTAMRDAGTCRAGAWEGGACDPSVTIPNYANTLSWGGRGAGGYSVNPATYNGWARNQKDFNYNSPDMTWYKAPQVKEYNPESNKSGASAAGCKNYVNTNGSQVWGTALLNGTEWVRTKMNNFTEYDGMGLITISGNVCHDTTDYLNAMFPSNNSTIRAGLESLANATTSSGDKRYLDEGMLGGDSAYPGLYSNGLSLFRREFTLDTDALDRIESAEANFGGEGGLFLDMVADDYYTVYINGCKVVSNVWNSAKVSKISIPYTYLHGPDNRCSNLYEVGMDPSLDPSKDSSSPNLLAIEVLDRIQIGRGWNDIGGTGLGYTVVLRDAIGYKLTPETRCGIDSGGVIDWNLSFVSVGDVVTCEHTVTKSGTAPTVHSDTARWVACDTYNADGSYKSYTDSNADGLIDWWETNDPAGCQLDWVEDDTLNTVWRTFTVPAGYQPGDQICTFIGYEPSVIIKLSTGVYRVKTNPDGSYSWAESRDDPDDLINRKLGTTCVTVSDPAVLAPRPHSYFFGGDVFSHSDIRFGTTSLYPRSRSQYAMLAQGGITNPITANDYHINPNRLVYANAGALGYLGVTNPTNPINPVGATNYMGGSINITTSPPAVHGTTEFQFYTPSSGTIEINGVANVSSQITVRVDGNVKILGNITLDNIASYSLANLPNVTIIASGDIIIDNSVTLVEATLIAGGSLKTCASQPINQSECNLRLTINGPTRAKDYYLYRTSTATDTEASENFYFPPSAIMAPYARGSGSVVPTTEYETELPPRY